MTDDQLKIIEDIKGGLIVSCQAKKDDPIYLADIVVKMAESAVWGGAVGIRANTPEDISKIRKAVDLPIIGLWKIYSDNSDVFITPNMEAVKAVVDAGSDIIAVDATDRLNADGEKAYKIIKRIKEMYPELLILADIRNADEAVNALKEGAHMVAPTLYRFNDNPKSIDSPDFETLAEIVKRCRGLGYVIMEGKINTPEEAMESIFLGAHAVVVGSAITRPHLTTLRFARKLKKYDFNMPLYY